MTTEEFKLKRESDDRGGGITIQDIAKCAVERGISKQPYICDMMRLTYQVLLKAGVDDAEEYNPDNQFIK